MLFDNVLTPALAVDEAMLWGFLFFQHCDEMVQFSSV